MQTFRSLKRPSGARFSDSSVSLNSDQGLRGVLPLSLMLWFDKGDEVKVTHLSTAKTWARGERSGWSEGATATYCCSVETGHRQGSGRRGCRWWVARGQPTTTLVITCFFSCVS
ncbi:hypothetical protein L596_024661 [Steinernema carpocapsae]|uniref:Uncharacterized protein n=1 Tax=Steinernema carpocapsae TaxID=34508 RepID=A0A4V6XVR1_STECR|nr:hypothetical protein L596_024661 [Steinernema carpocapsae]